ncbi:hypothetical protein SHIRM173S_08750 [Streptomyces hirsutus]
MPGKVPRKSTPSRSRPVYSGPTVMPSGVSHNRSSPPAAFSNAVRHSSGPTAAAGTSSIAEKSGMDIRTLPHTVERGGEHGDGVATGEDIGVHTRVRPRTAREEHVPGARLAQGRGGGPGLLLVHGVTGAQAHLFAPRSPRTCRR